MGSWSRTTWLSTLRRSDSSLRFLTRSLIQGADVLLLTSHMEAVRSYVRADTVTYVLSLPVHVEAASSGYTTAD